MGSWKIERELAHGLEPDGLPQILRELADALETGVGGAAAVGLLHGLPARDWRKLVLVAERRDAGLTLRLKVKRSGEIRVPTALEAPRKTLSKVSGKDRPQAAREKYRQLKKALQTDFKALQAKAQAGLLPEAETLESFLSLAGLMGQAGQPEDGAALAEMVQANAMFLEDCQALRRSWLARDPAALGAVLERLARRKSACHAQFR